MSAENRPVNESFFITIMLGLAGWLIWSRVGPPLLHWWSTHETRILWSAGIFLVIGLVILGTELYNRYVDSHYKYAITAPAPTAVYVGRDSSGRKLHLSQAARTQHAQLIGTTGCGKTESVVLPWVIRDIECGAGVIIIDGKSDISFLEKLYAYVKRAGRESEFRLFSLAHPGISTSLNPLLGGTPKQVADRVFAGFTFEHGYYKNIQYQIFEALIRLIVDQKGIPTFVLIERLLTDKSLLDAWLRNCSHEKTKAQLDAFLSLPPEKRIENVSGLISQLSHFTSDELGPLFNPMKLGMRLDEIVEEGQIAYFQLPTMYYQFLAPATGKLLLQSLQTIIAERQIGLMDRSNFLSVFLDDFQDYMYPEFASLFNKTRSSNVGVVLSHQSFGDLEKVGTAFRDTVVSSTNIKIAMRSNEPESADYLARFFGTETNEKTTERETKGVLGKTKTGERSVREVEQYIHHPNVLKKLPVGQGVMSFPHFMGNEIVKVTFLRRPDLMREEIPKVEKEPFDPTTLLSPPKSTVLLSKKIDPA